MLSYEELVELGTIETSPLPFVTLVREARGHEQKIVESYIGCRQANKISTSIKRLKLRVSLSQKPKGCGYTPSSFRNDRNREALITSLIVSGFLESEMGVEPLVVGIQDFYKFFPGNSSFVDKTTMISDIEKRKFGGPKHALIVSGFSDFEIFSDDVLEQVPHQRALGLYPYEENISPDLKSFGMRLMDFSRDTINLLAGKEKSLDIVFDKLIKSLPDQSAESAQNAKILFATSLLLQDIQPWQNLWYEGSDKGGVPLYIVAPACFHNAMNRVNFSWGHGAMDYQYRSSCSLGAGFEPLFEIENGKVLLGDALEERAMEVMHNQGLSSEDVLSRLDPVLRHFEKILSLNPSANLGGELAP